MPTTSKSPRKVTLAAVGSGRRAVADTPIFDGGWMQPVYDAAGNMTAGPKPGDETTAAIVEQSASFAGDRAGRGLPRPRRCRLARSHTGRRHAALLGRPRGPFPAGDVESGAAHARREAQRSKGTGRARGGPRKSATHGGLDDPTGIRTRVAGLKSPCPNH